MNWYKIILFVFRTKLPKQTKKTFIFFPFHSFFYQEWYSKHKRKEIYCMGQWWWWWCVILPNSYSETNRTEKKKFLVKKHLYIFFFISGHCTNDQWWLMIVKMDAQYTQRDRETHTHINCHYFFVEHLFIALAMTTGKKRLKSSE